MEALLVDGHSILHRCFRAPGYNLTAPDGTPTKAIYGTLREVVRLVETRGPHYLTFAVDTPRNLLWRRAIYPEYKANRKTGGSGNLAEQISLTKEILKALGVPVLEVPTQEADDVIATLVDRLPEGDTAAVVTGDKDLAQLVCGRVGMVRDGRYWTPGDVTRRYGVIPTRMRDYLTLRGDSVDNVPGVAGVGERSAIDLVYRYPSIRAMRVGAGTNGPRARVVAAHADGSLDLSRRLVTLDTDVPGLPDYKACRFRGFDWTNAQPLLDVLGIRPLRR